MANAITTLMQIGIEEMTKSRMVGEVGLIQAFYNNDDAALVFDSEANAVRYSSIDRGVCTNLGLAYKDKSTYIAHQHLNFCEQYIARDDRVNDKTAYSYDTLFLLWKGINASHARSLAMSMNLRGVSRHLAGYAMHYWGPVLYKNEYRRPRALGGWFRQVENGVDTSFVRLNGTMTVPQMEEAANWAYSETKLEYYPWLKFSSRETKRAKSYPKEWLLSGDVDLYIKRENTFKAEADVTENVRAWKSFEKKLRSNFSRACSWWAKRPSRRRTYADLYRSECDVRPKEDILPPIHERIETKSFEASFTADVEFEHPYRAPNRQIDLAIWRAGKQPDSYPRKMGFTGLLHVGAKDIPHMKKGSAQRAISLRHLQGESKVPLKIWNLYLVPDQATFQYWHNPFAIGAVADAFGRNYNSYIPKYISPKKQELLDLRTSYYGKVLTWKEWMYIGTLNPADIQMLSLLKDYFGTECHEDDLVNQAVLTFVREFRKYPGFGGFIDSLENFEATTIIEGFAKWAKAVEISTGTNKTRKEKEDEDRLNEAIFEEFFDDVNIVAEKGPIEDFYVSRSRDPWGYYEQAPGEEIPNQPVEDILAEICASSDEEIIDEMSPEEVEDLLDDFFGGE